MGQAARNAVDSPRNHPSAWSSVAWFSVAWAASHAGELTVGDTDAGVGHTHFSYHLDQARPERLVAAEVTRRSTSRERQRTRLFEHEPRHQLLHHAHHGFELPHVAAVVDLDHGEVGVARLRLTATQSHHDPFGSRFG